ncbi:MAG TPA: glycoside hydrolase family 9 protein [Fimbriimonas sp.]|nr:glycoside hydrolase family 9 protein [Fimbriimonas sp.]
MGFLTAALVLGKPAPQDIPNITRIAPFNTAVKVCQVGYKPSESKFAIVTKPASGDAVIYRIGSTTPVMTVPVGAAVSDPDTGDEVRWVDFSKLTKAGEYEIEVPGVGKSAPFKVGNGVFANPMRLAMRSYYGQRASTDVDMGPEFPMFKYKAGHTAPATYHASTGKTGTRDVSGGWYDAGDYGRYVVNSGITTGTLLWAFEMNTSKLSKLKLNIPETGKSKLPDYLSEVKYNLDWMLKMQDEDGGAYHKATTANFPGFIMPDKDNGQMFVIGTGKGKFKNTTATADLAAVAAIAARIYKRYDPAYAAKCLDAAKRGFEWSQANPNELFANNPQGISTGGYGDRDARDERLWAAAELYRTTGDTSYQDAFLKLAKEWNTTLEAGEAPGWPQVRPMALMTFAMTKHKSVNKEYQQRVLDDLKTAADGIADRVEKNPYKMPLRSGDYYWGSNAVVANFALMLQVADRMKPNPRHRQAALDSIHYLMGRNTFATSFVSQVGVHYAMNPHHRWSGADGVAEPWPGLLMGGPNAEGKNPPARQWVDDWKSYTTNEIAINWNAPLVFILSNTL